MPSPSLPNSVQIEDSRIMETSLLILKKQVERATALGLSWDTAVQLLVLQGLIEVSSQLETFAKALSANNSPNSYSGSGRRDERVRPAPEDPSAGGSRKGPRRGRPPSSNKAVD